MKTFRKIIFSSLALFLIGASIFILTPISSSGYLSSWYSCGNDPECLIEAASKHKNAAICAVADAGREDLCYQALLKKVRLLDLDCNQFKAAAYKSRCLKIDRKG